MDAWAFRVKWEIADDELCQFPPAAVALAQIPDGAKEFLLKAGLPCEAAPFLAFRPNNLQWLQSGGCRSDLARYYGIGSDGSGNPVVIDTDGIVWLLDHEVDRRTFVNSSIEALAACLLAYRTLVSETVDAGGEEAFLDSFAPRHAIEAFAASAAAADTFSLETGTFWHEELCTLSARDR